MLRAALVQTVLLCGVGQAWAQSGGDSITARASAPAAAPAATVPVMDISLRLESCVGVAFTLLQEKIMLEAEVRKLVAELRAARVAGQKE